MSGSSMEPRVTLKSLSLKRLSRDLNLRRVTLRKFHAAAGYPCFFKNLLVFEGNRVLMSEI